MHIHTKVGDDLLFDQTDSPAASIFLRFFFAWFHHPPAAGLHRWDHADFDLADAGSADCRMYQGLSLWLRPGHSLETKIRWLIPKLHKVTLGCHELVTGFGNIHSRHLRQCSNSNRMDFRTDPNSSVSRPQDIFLQVAARELFDPMWDLLTWNQFPQIRPTSR